MDFKFDRFPAGGDLYRIHWAGAYLPPKPRTTTPRVAVWLSKLIHNEKGEYELETTVHDGKRALSLLMLDESAGSIPSLPIGTIWRDGIRYIPEDFVSTTASFFIDRNATWEIVTVSDAVNDGTEPWLPSHSYPMRGVDEGSRLHNLEQAPLVKVTARGGAILLIPAYELFRTYFAPTSEFAREILSKRFSLFLAKFILHREGPTGNPPVLSMKIAGDLSPRTVAILALLSETMIGLERASLIYTELVNHRRLSIPDLNWIKALPPFQNERTSIALSGKWIDKNHRFLGFQIEELSFPKLPFSIRLEKDEVRKPIPTPQPTDGQGESQKPLTGLGLLDLTHPDDAAPTRQRIKLASDAIRWLPDTLPRIKSAPRNITYYPAGSKKGESSHEPRKASTGRISKDGTHPQANMESQEQQEIVERFSALESTLIQLKADEEISAWHQHAIVRPRDFSRRSYCELVDISKPQTSSWPIIKVDPIRSRVAWLLQIEFNTKLLYLLDMETAHKTDYRSMLLFMPLKDKLSEQLVDRIFAYAVMRKGRFPRSVDRAFESELKWELASHKIKDSRMSEGPLMGAIKKLVGGLF